MTIPRERLIGPAALIVALACTSALHADSFTFRNDCSEPIIVQIATVQRGVLKREQAVVKPNEVTPRLPLDANKLITVYDSKFGRVLFREVLHVSKMPLNYSIISDPRFPGRVAMKRIPPGAGKMGPPAPSTKGKPAPKSPSKSAPKRKP